MKWKNFKTHPPYDAYLDDLLGMEVDYVHAYFLYRYTHRPHLAKTHVRISYGPCRYSNGVFEGYESHMRTSPHKCDWIEVLYWVGADEVRKSILEKWKGKEEK